MSNEALGIGSIFLLTGVLLFLRHGLLLIARRRQKLHGVYLLQRNRDDRTPDPDPEPDSEDNIYRTVKTDLASFAGLGVDRHSIK